MGYLFVATFLIDLIPGDEGAAKKAEEADNISVVAVHEYLSYTYEIASLTQDRR